MSTNLSTLIVETLLCQAVARGNVMNTKGTGTPKRKGIRDKHHIRDAQSHPPEMRSLSPLVIGQQLSGCQNLTSLSCDG